MSSRQPRSVTAGTTGDAWHGDWRALIEQGLLTRETITSSGGGRELGALAREGKAVLDALAASRADSPRQEYYAGIVKPRAGRRLPPISRQIVLPQERHRVRRCGAG